MDKIRYDIERSINVSAVVIADIKQQSAKKWRISMADDNGKIAFLGNIHTGTMTLFRSEQMANVMRGIIIDELLGNPE